jgi:hypothetical protein
MSVWDWKVKVTEQPKQLKPEKQALSEDETLMHRQFTIYSRAVPSQSHTKVKGVKK